MPDQSRSLLFQFHDRHAISATRLYGPDFNFENLPCSRQQFKRFPNSPHSPSWAIPVCRAINPENLGWPAETAKHDRDPSIGDQMGVRFVPRACEVQPGNFPVIQDAKDIVSLGGKIHPPICSRGCDEKDRLSGNKLRDVPAQAIQKTLPSYLK